MEQIANPNVWTEYGLAGLVILGLGAFVYHMSRQHHDERKEWRSENRADRRETTEAVNRNTEAVNALRDVVRGK